MNQRALEAVARALCIAVGDDPDQLTYAHEMRCTGRDREPMHRWRYWTVHSEAVITAYEAHLKTEGFVVVRAEPTDKMICAALDDYDKRGRGKQSYRDIYRAMLQAAQGGEDA